MPPWCWTEGMREEWRTERRIEKLGRVHEMIVEFEE